MLRSIRWTLQLWYAAILIMAIVWIGAASYFTIRHARYAEIDSELSAAGQVLLARLRSPSPGDRPLPRDDFGLRPGPRPQGVGQSGFEEMRGFDNNWPQGSPPPSAPPPPARQPGEVGFRGPDRLPRVIELPPGFLQGYGGTIKDSRSFVIFRPGKDVIRSWGVDYPAEFLPNENQAPVGDKPNFRSRGVMHEILFAAPGHTAVLVGGSVQQVDEELKQLIWKLTAAAAGVLVIGLIGGGIISQLALRPIGLMSRTAGSISATRMTGRIETRRVPSELRKLANVLNQMFDRLGLAFDQQVRFTADASHELRTPLAVILSHTELALSRDRSGDEYRKTIQTCMSAALRIKALIESLLLLSQADAGELSLQNRPMDLSDVVRDSVSLLTTLASQRSITIVTQLQNATLIGDPSRLGQVVANLLSNAIRYNQVDQSITVATQVIGGDAVLSVADTGGGITIEDQPRIFDRFFRTDKARSRDIGGSGLGLAICKSIVEAHGGLIQVQSNPGAGTTFEVKIPRRIQDVSATLQSGEASPLLKI